MYTFLSHQLPSRPFAQMSPERYLSDLLRLSPRRQSAILFTICESSCLHDRQSKQYLEPQLYRLEYHDGSTLTQSLPKVQFTV